MTAKQVIDAVQEISGHARLNLFEEQNARRRQCLREGLLHLANAVTVFEMLASSDDARQPNSGNAHHARHQRGTQTKAFKALAA